MSGRPEPQECVRYSAIWHTATVDGQVVKLYSLTKPSMDKLDNAATKGQVQLVEKQMWELRQIVQPVLVQMLKRELEKVLETKTHRLRTLLGKVPNGSLYQPSSAYDAMHELVAEGKAREVKGGWRKK